MKTDCQDRLYSGNRTQQSGKLECQGKTEMTLYVIIKAVSMTCQAQHAAVNRTG